MRKNLKAKYWKRTLALLLAVSMILTGNAFSIDAVSVYAAEKDEVSGEVASPEKGAAEVEDSTGLPDTVDVPAAGDAGDSTDAPDAGDVPAAGDAGDSADAPDAGDVPAAGDAEDSADTPDAGEAGDLTDTPDAGETGDSTDVPDEEDVTDAGEVEEPAEVLESTNTTEDGNPEDGTPEDPEGENPAGENYTGLGLDASEFEGLIGAADPDFSDPNYENRWKGVGTDDNGTAENLLTDIYENDGGSHYEYAYIKPCNPDIEYRTITIPDTFKGVFIDNGWAEENTGNEGGDGDSGSEGIEGGESNGYAIDISLDTLNVNGENTCVYFRKGSSINAGDSNKLSINFPENNKNKVVFDNNFVNAVIDCNSESGTIAFGDSNIINGYMTKSTTEFYAAQNYEGIETLDYSDLVIKEAGGLSFEEITGEVNVSIIFNGYPEDIENLPHFNKKICLKEIPGEGENEPEYEGNVTIKFKQYKETLFEGDEDIDNEWWNEDEVIEKGTRVAYFAGITKKEIEPIRERVSYWNDSKSEEDNNLYVSYTGCLAVNDEDESCAYWVLKLDDDTEYGEVKTEEKDIWDESSYGERWDETDNLAAYLESDGIEYVVIQAKESSQELDDKVLELPSKLKGVMLVPDYIPVTNDPDAPNDTEKEDERVDWHLDTLNVGAGTEVYMNDIGIIDVTNEDFNIDVGSGANVYMENSSIDTKGKDFNINMEAGAEVHMFAVDIDTNEKNLNIDMGADTSKVVFESCTVNALINGVSEGTIEYVGDNTINGYITNTKTHFSSEPDDDNAKLLIKEAAGLSFEEITGDVTAWIIFNGYPENTADLENKLPHFNKPIDLGEVDDSDAEGGKRSRTVNIGFRVYRDMPFEDESEDGWWNGIPKDTRKENDMIAYFAGTSRNEMQAIGEKVSYDGVEGDGLYLCPSTGSLMPENEGPGEAAYAVLELGETEYNAAKVNKIDVWDGSYDEKWDETDTLDEYLKIESRKYVVIQARELSYDLDDRVLDLPENIKGVLLLSENTPVTNDADVPDDPDNVNYERVDWHLDTLKVKAGTEVYINGIDIATSNNVFNIDLAAATSKVVFGSQCFVNALVKCESEAGTIEFIDDNIINGYITNTKTHFSASEPPEGEEPSDNAKLLIKEAAGLSFEEITGDVDVLLIFNGYPENTADLETKLPHFNKPIDLGEVEDSDAEGGKRNRDVSIRFWGHVDKPFWLGVDDWWEPVDAVDLQEGAQVAYFAGTTREEKELIQCNVGYYNHTHDNNGLYLSYTGRLEKEGEEESHAYRVLNLNNADAYNEVKVNTDLLWDKNGKYHDKLWDETSTLDAFLEGDLEYVVIQATKDSHELEDKTLKLPANIKGAILVQDWDEEANSAVEWRLNSIKAEGSKEICICNMIIDPIGQQAGAADAGPAEQGLKIETTSANVNVVVFQSQIMGDLSVSGIAGIKFNDSQVRGAIDLGRGKTTKVSLESLLIADNLNGYSALEITGDTTLIVRYHGAVVIENCKFTRTNQGDEGQGLTIVYNGYPAEAELLPEFGDNIDFPDMCGITLRFVQQSDDLFWEADNWWEKTPDELLSLGSQIATVKIDGDKFESLLEHLGYWSSNEEFIKNIELVRDENGALRIQKTNPETGKRVVDFLWSAEKTKVYDGAAFAISEKDVTNNCGYTGSAEFAWLAKDGTKLEQAPKDAGEYKFRMSVPADDQKFEGETTADVTITPRTVTVSIKPDESKADGYEIIWTGFVEGETYITQAEVVKGEEITEDNKKYCMASTKGGDAGSNYTIVHADPVKIAVKETPLVNEKRPIINSVKFPKNQDSFSAVYTGEQICPAMVVAYTYTDGSKTKTQKLKLNVDYTLTYQNNVSAGNNTAKVTVRGIGEFSGVITREFSITPKSIKKVTLSAVGDIIYGDDPVVAVMDGAYELAEGIDYEIVLSTSGSSETDTQSELTVRGIGNYTDTSGKKVKFNILKSSTVTSPDIKSIAAESVTLEFKKLPAKGYTYSGKAVKPAVMVMDGGVKVPASQYKVIYSNNVNAGTKTAVVKVVGVTKKGKGYYGVSKELKFDIKQKDFAKVSVSSIAAVPKTSSFEGITMTVKDGKRILVEDLDYTVDYSSILNNDGTFKANIVTGQKYPLVLKPVGGKNYVDTSAKTVYVKFGQLNLASKTANISVTIKDASKNEVEVIYNGVLLTKDTDYTAQVKPDKNKSTYTVTIKAVKKSAYKGKKVIKNLADPTTSEQ